MEKFNPDWAKDVPCRNIIIYGYCKKEKDGCPFRHDIEEMHGTMDAESPPAVNSTVLVQAPARTTPMPSLLSLNNLSKKSQTSLNQKLTPAQVQLQSSSAPSGHKFNAKISESFTPFSMNKQEDAIPTTEKIEPPKKITLPFSPSQIFVPNFDAYNSESFTPTSTKGNPMEDAEATFSNVNLANNNNTGTSPIINNQMLIPGGQNMLQFDPHSLPTPNGSLPLNNGMPTPSPMFPHPLAPNNQIRYPSIYPPPHSILQYHLYAPDPPPHLQLPLKPNERTPEMLFIPNNIREQLVKKNLAALQMFPPGGALPDIVQDYYGLVPLDFHQKNTAKDRYNGHKNSLFKVFSNLDGNIYVLRRIHNIIEAIEPQQISQTFNKWKNISSSNVVKLKDCFLTTKFGDSSLCFVYDYYPSAISLYETHFINFPLVPITQNYLWTYLIQLTNAMKEIHSNNLVVNNIDWEKIIVTGDPGRVKISSCGELDLLNYKPDIDFTEIRIKQQQDYVKLGELLLKLSKNIQQDSSDSSNNKSISAQIDNLKVEEDFKIVLKYLLDDSNKDKSIKELSKLFIDQIFIIFDSLNTYSEHTESILSKELENARLFRLICKLNFIFGRIESRIDINWSESGEKFPIVLFYDYVFHQVDSMGKYLMDLTHVLRCLNKLDAGVTEKLVLATPDEMNCIIISYKELRELINSTFRSLTQ